MMQAKNYSKHNIHYMYTVSMRRQCIYTVYTECIQSVCTDTILTVRNRNVSIICGHNGSGLIAGHIKAAIRDLRTTVQ